MNLQLEINSESDRLREPKPGDIVHVKSHESLGTLYKIDVKHADDQEVHGCIKSIYTLKGDPFSSNSGTQYIMEPISFSRSQMWKVIKRSDFQPH